MPYSKAVIVEIRPPIADDLTAEKIRLFFSIGFTHHYEIIAKTQSFEERIFYIEHCALEFWSKESYQITLKQPFRIKTCSEKLCCRSRMSICLI
jgi:hypothetical protein